MRLQGINRFRMPDDELAFARELVDHRRSVARFLRAQRPPAFLARLPVESDRDTPRPAHETDHLVAVHERMSGETPQGSLDAEVLLQIARPVNRSGFGAETEQMAFASDRVNLAVVHGRGHARAGGITHGVSAIVFVLPHDFAGGFVEAEDAFASGNLPAGEGIGRRVRIFGQLTVHDINPAARDGGAAVPAADRSSPAKGQAAGGKLLDDAGFTPDAVALRAEPLR